MKQRRWVNVSAPESAAQRWLGSISRAAAAGKPIESLLEFAARAFLAAGHADRAGIWVERETRATLWEGVVIRSRAPGAPIEIAPCDPARLPAGVLAGRAAVEEHLPPSDSAPPFHWLDGMYTAVWLPLHANEEVFGTVMVAHASPGIAADRDVLDDLEAELSIVCAEYRTRDRLNRVQQETEAWTGLQRALLHGTGGNQMLQAVASAAVQHTGAEFVALGRIVGNDIRWEALTGWAECSPFLQAAATREVIYAAHQKGRPATFWLPELPAGCSAEIHAPAFLVAHPLTADGAAGVLLAGFAQEIRSGENRLEPYAVLGSTALGKSHPYLQSTGVETAFTAFTALFDSSAEPLLIVDSRGAVEQCNRRARELLAMRDPFAGDRLLPAFFAPSSREGIAGWLRSSAVSSPTTRGAAALYADGLLETGYTVRIHPRGVLAPGKRLLLALEEGSLAERAEQKWRQLEAELRSVLDAVEAGVVLMDLTGRIRFANAQFSQLLGLDKHAMADLASFEELMDYIKGRFRDPQGFANRWRDLSGRGDEAVREELEMVRPVSRTDFFRH